MCRVRVIHDTQDHVPDAVTRQLSDKAVVTRVRDFVCVLKMLITCSSSNTADYVCRISVPCSRQTNTPHNSHGLCRMPECPDSGQNAIYRALQAGMPRMSLPTGHGDPVNDVALEPHTTPPSEERRTPPLLPPSHCLCASGPFGLDPYVLGPGPPIRGSGARSGLSPATPAGPPRPH